MANGDANYVWTEAALVGVVEMRNGGVGKLHVVDQRAYGSQLCTTNNELELGGIISGQESVAPSLDRSCRPTHN
jgi:hypothetical protein